ncbi:MAG: hypothetical protein WBN64_09550 [Candidatus Deferrimicrobium sp.]
MANVLFICGTLNQTTQMHAVARHLGDCGCFFTPYFADGFVGVLARKRMVDFTALGGAMRQATDAYLRAHDLPVDEEGRRNRYDLVVTCSDLIVQRSVRGKKLVLVQEGMTDPENAMYRVVRSLGLPRYLASSSTTGLSHAYDKFCVASEGYREHFIRKGVAPERIVVTGIPNFDHAESYLQNDFPHRGHVLVATSDTRETFKLDNRRRFLRKALAIADGRLLVFKLHPNENVARNTAEIRSIAPGALVYSEGNAHHMVANADVLVTQYSTLAYTGILLGKEVHSYFDVETLKRLAPLQNGGTSGREIAAVCRGLLEERWERRAS